MATTTKKSGFNPNSKMGGPGGQSHDSRPWQGEGNEHQPFNRLLHSAKKYARDNPESAALWCFGIGFVLGWKLKPW